jgi:hypothetical protein
VWIWTPFEPLHAAAAELGIPVLGHAPHGLGLAPVLEAGHTLAHIGELAGLHFFPPYTPFQRPLYHAAIGLLAVLTLLALIIRLKNRRRSRPTVPVALPRLAVVGLVFSLPAYLLPLVLLPGGLRYGNAWLIGILSLAVLVLLITGLLAAWSAFVRRQTLGVRMLLGLTSAAALTAGILGLVQDLPTALRATDAGMERTATRLAASGARIGTTLVLYDELSVLRRTGAVTRIEPNAPAQIDAADRLDPEFRAYYLRMREILARTDWRSRLTFDGLLMHYDHFTRDLAFALHRAGVPLLAGTDAFGVGLIPPGRSLHVELAILVEAGLSPYEALQAATVEPARFLGREQEFGQVAVGQRADLVLLASNPLVDIAAVREIQAVMLRGHWLEAEQIEFMIVQAAAQPEPTVPSLQHYALEVTIDYERERLDGSATLVLRNDSTAPADRIPLLLNRLMRAEAVRSDAGALSFSQRVTVFEDLSKFQVNAVEIMLAEPIDPGQQVQIQVDYGGHLTGYTEIGYLYVRDHISRDFTILRQEALAFPWPGLPSEQANRAAGRSDFSYVVDITVPKDQVAASGGRQSIFDIGDNLLRYRYESNGQTPLLYVTVAAYELIEAEGLRVFHFPSDDDGAARLLAAAEAAAGRFDSIFGPSGRPLELTIMQIPDGFGSQANPVAGIIQESAAFYDRNQLQQIYHELSHLWNAADIDPDPPRWNEGLAMFLQGRIAAELDGWEGHAVTLERRADWLRSRCSGEAPCARIPMIDYGKERMTGFSYSVGMLMFAALYETLGESEFDRALHTHFQRYRESGTRTEDLVSVFVEIGGQPVQDIFDRWLFSTDWIADGTSN